ncbi:MAG: hypothetical protein IPK67_19795 [Planctomycetes bacterium]|nr:hypothetical protein [Planctomycetota bacterium]
MEVELASEDHRCEDCDFTLDVSSTYQRDAPLLWRAPECAWEDLASWTMGETFAARWGFTGQSEGTGAGWPGLCRGLPRLYPTAEATYAMAESGAATLTWTFTYEEDALGSIESGYWVLDLGGLDL